MIDTENNSILCDMLDKNNVKLLFSLISILLLIPPMLTHSVYYYSTLFVFLSGKMVDLLAFSYSVEKGYFFVWQVVNRWGSVVVCAFTFSLLLPTFYQLFLPYIDVVNGCLFIFPFSCFLQELTFSILKDIRIRAFNEYHSKVN